MGLIDSLGSTNPLIKNMLTRVLGLEEKVDVYITPIKPEKGDIVVICSDGLTNYLTEKSIRVILDDFSVSLERRPMGIDIDLQVLAADSFFNGEVDEKGSHGHVALLARGFVVVVHPV